MYDISWHLVVDFYQMKRNEIVWKYEYTLYLFQAMDKPKWKKLR